MKLNCTKIVTNEPLRDVSSDDDSACCSQRDATQDFTGGRRVFLKLDTQDFDEEIIEADEGESGKGRGHQSQHEDLRTGINTNDSF